MTRKANDENFFVEKYAIAQDATPFESRRTDARRDVILKTRSQLWSNVTKNKEEQPTLQSMTIRLDCVWSTIRQNSVKVLVWDLIATEKTDIVCQFQWHQRCGSTARPIGKPTYPSRFQIFFTLKPPIFILSIKAISSKNLNGKTIFIILFFILDTGTGTLPGFEFSFRVENQIWEKT